MTFLHFYLTYTELIVDNFYKILYIIYIIYPFF